jgi:hypothetical protein
MFQWQFAWNIVVQFSLTFNSDEAGELLEFISLIYI